MIWKTRGARQGGYVDRSDWITRAWLLIRKVISQDGQPTVNDVRVARILLHYSGRFRNAPNHLIKMIEEVVIDGTHLAPLCPHCAGKEEAGLGPQQPL